jgi:integrase
MSQSINAAMTSETKNSGTKETSSTPDFENEKKHIIERPSETPFAPFDNVGRLAPERGKLRSKVPPDGPEARVVTNGEIASQSMPVGASLAAGTAQRQARPAVRHEDEIDFENENIVPVLPTDHATDIGKRLSQSAILTIKAARAIVKSDTEARNRRQDTPPSANTLADYRKKLTLLDALVESNHTVMASPALIALMPYSSRKSSFYAMKAALRWRVLSQLKTLLAAQDEAQRTKNWGTNFDECIEALGFAVRQFKELDAATFEECQVWSSKTTLQPRSKKDTLRKLPEDWKEQFLEQNDRSPTYRAPGLLMCLCGFRPEELRKGVTVTLKGDHIAVEMSGAKVRGTAGQPWRTFQLERSAFPNWFMDELSATGEQTYSAKTDAFRVHVKRISEKLFPEKSKNGEFLVKLSPYVFRHSVATDLRQSGWDTADIAGVLGEKTADTQRHYGLRSYTKGKAPKKSSIIRGSLQTARSVRPANTAGLAAVQRSSAKSRLKNSRSTRLR